MNYIICTTNQKVSKETSAKTAPTNNKTKAEIKMSSSSSKFMLMTMLTWN